MTDESTGFPAQQQEPPGLTSPMEPIPDHGEESYVGNGRLDGRKALVTALTRSRGRTTVVSGLRAEDLDRTRLRSEGAQDLLDLLTYLYTGEDPALEATDDLGPTDEPAPTDDAAEPDATEESEDAEQSDDAEEPEGESEDATDEPEATETPVDGEAPGDEVTETPTETIEAEAEDETTAADPAAPDAVDAVDALVADLADRLWRRGIVVTPDYGLTEDRIELALGHPDLPGRYLVAVDTDGARYVATASQRERDRLRAERLEAAGWATERVWSWALFIDPEGEAERIARSVERALDRVTQAEAPGGRGGAGASPHLLPRPQVPPGQPLGFYSTEDLDEVVEYICSDGRARLVDVAPYWTAGLGATYFNVRFPGWDVRKGWAATGYVGVGVGLGSRVMLEARYRGFTRIEGLDFSGWNLTAGVRF